MTDIEYSVQLPVVALRGIVIFPDNDHYFDIGRPKSIAAMEQAMETGENIFLTAQRELASDDPGQKELFETGVVCRVKQLVKVSDGLFKVLVEGLFRAKLLSFYKGELMNLATVVPTPEKTLRQPYSDKITALVRQVKEEFDHFLDFAPRIPKDILMNIIASDDPVYLVNYMTSHAPFDYKDKQAILESSTLSKKLELLLKTIKSEVNILQLEREIGQKVKQEMDRNQKEYYLREQMRVIKEELGEDEENDDLAVQYTSQIKALKLDSDSEEKLLKEAKRLSKIPSSTQEANVITTYLDTVLELPFHTETKDQQNMKKAQSVLEGDHFGLTKVKERILETLAVNLLAGKNATQILCLAGPPGVGKTSVAKSIAKSLNKNFVRVSLGGVNDESEIRGHRRTYVGAMPGKIIKAIESAKSKNPVILLDEIDKMGATYKGDPASAMLEVLDSEQNNNFKDHYIEVPFDLSSVLFIATANDIGAIPAPLRDRMELIEIESYTREEKFQIAKKFLLKKQIEKNGLTSSQIKITDGTLYVLIENYTKEAGVRNLERYIARLCQKVAKEILFDNAKKMTVTVKNVERFLGPKIFKNKTQNNKNKVGVVNGLAWTSVGGETLPIEVVITPGTGKIVLTGNLGEVMKESATIALTHVRSIGKKFGIEKEFYKQNDIHVHAPQGAVPKDGPSAGIALATVILSALTGTPVRGDVAMTGEITLRGEVLPIGGLKEKAIGAFKEGMKTVLLPYDNESDLQYVEDNIKEAIHFVPVKTFHEVIEYALDWKEETERQIQKEEYIINLGTATVPKKKKEQPQPSLV